MSPDRHVAIVGLGYVGLPLGLAFHEAGMRVVGVDPDEARLAQISRGESPIDDVADTRLAAAVAGGLEVRPTLDGRSADVDAIFVCVPTPITAELEPDLSAVLSAADDICPVLRAGQLVVLQSTTYPGTTAGPFRAALERSGLRAGRDFGLAYAPERLSPGDASSIAAPRLVGGLTAHDTERAASLLRALGGTVHELSSPDAAEMAKLLENVFRNVNIALVNQLALICERLGLDIWEVIDAAATKPFGFMPFRPGPGVGGHCIPVDPYYLAWRARQAGVTDRFVEIAGDVNRQMPRHVVDLVAQALDSVGRSLDGARVGVLGVAFKPDVRDQRNAPALEVIAELAARGAEVTFHDPHVASFVDRVGRMHASLALGELLRRSDVVVALVGHAAIDWSRVYRDARLVVDAVNSVRLAEGAGSAARVLRLGAGWLG
jgi:UDP-N-acetyl-D-glucosamine dehydrogenase